LSNGALVQNPDIGCKRKEFLVLILLIRSFFIIQRSKRREEMRFVLTWEEFKMLELLLIHLKENAFKKEQGSIASGNYEISWNQQVIMVELQLKVMLEKILLTLEGLEDV